MKERSAAILTIHNAASYSVQGKADILAWLKEQVASFEKDSSSFAKNYRARYLYCDKGSDELDGDVA
jgi:hypothetical protein